MDPNVPQFTGVWTNGAITRYFFLRGEIRTTLGDIIVAETAAKYYVDIKNPCVQENSIIVQELTGMVIQVGQTAE